MSEELIKSAIKTYAEDSAGMETPSISVWSPNRRIRWELKRFWRGVKIRCSLHSVVEAGVSVPLAVDVSEKEL